MDIKKPTYIDLFAGCGGLSLGLHNSNWKGIFAIEKSPDAFATLKFNLIDNLNHFNWPDWLPQTNLNINSVLRKYKNQLQSLQGKVDLVAGGPPCQGFSTAGRRIESDSRNDLIKSYIKFIRLVKPKIIFFENVKGFTQEFRKNRDKGKKYSTYVEKRLSKLGYDIKGELVNFGDYGIPQKRTRFILVGIRNDVIESNVLEAKLFFSMISDNKSAFLINKELSVNTNLQDAISDLLKSNGTICVPENMKFQIGKYGKPTSSYQELMREKVESTIADSHRFPNHQEDIVSKFEYIINNCKKNKDIGEDVRKKYKIKKHTIVPLDKNEKTPTITSLPDDYIHYSEPRILTVREYARIQSFPDDFEFKGKYTSGGKRRVQEVPRYTQIGNAIPPIFGEQCGLVLKYFIS